MGTSSSSGMVVARLWMWVLAVVLAGTWSCGATPPLPTVSVALVNRTFVNELTTSVKVTETAPPLGTAFSTVIPPGEERELPEELQAPLMQQKGVLFQVGNETFSFAGSVLGAVPRVVEETGTSKFYITGPCFQQPGLQYVVTTALDVPTRFGCLTPVKS